MRPLVSRRLACAVARTSNDVVAVHMLLLSASVDDAWAREVAASASVWLGSNRGCGTPGRRGQVALDGEAAAAGPEYLAGLGQSSWPLVRRAVRGSVARPTL